jgi:endonuclease YncB( thermonuclease family)
MRHKWATAGLVGVLMLPVGIFGTSAGDSLYGTVTAVRSAEIVVFDYGPGQYVVRIVGINAPTDTSFARQATQFVANLVLKRKARIRLEGRAPNGQMVSRLFTADSVIGIKDVGLELVRAGLARRQASYDYKYGELAAAENEARQARRGLWATAPR